jgi:membrane-bound metal-dependent hydrolase YbcI (DUF457 family)
VSLPVAHALTGITVFALARPHLGALSPRLAFALALTLPVVPDLDFAPVWFLGLDPEVWHRTFTHSIVFALVCGAAAWGCLHRRPGGAAAAGVVAVWVLSHALVDMLGHAPGGATHRGVMLLWPFDTAYYASPWQPLPPGERTSVARLLEIAAVEAAWCGPPAALAWWWSRRRLVPRGRARA